MKRVLSVIGVVLVVGCGGPEPRDMGTLRGVDGLYLNPEDGQPYSGPVFGENNVKKMTGSLRDGKWDGPFESYHENGQLRRRGTYKDGVEDGPVEEYTTTTVSCMRRVPTRMGNPVVSGARVRRSPTTPVEKKSEGGVR